MGNLRVAAILFSVAVVFSAFGAAAQMGPTGPNGALVHPAVHDGVSYVNITTTNSFTFVPNTIEVNSRTVDIIISNPGGDVGHTFTLSSLVNQTAPPPSDTNWPSYFVWPNLYADRTVNESAVVYVNVTFSAVGAYQFICRPHYPLGMQGEIYVDESIAPSARAPLFSPFWYVVIAVVVLAFLATVLGVVYGKKGSGGNETHSPEHVPITSRVEYYNDSRPEDLNVSQRPEEPPEDDEGPDPE